MKENIPLEYLLPSNFEKFKTEIPDLFISNKLADKNPLKIFMEKIEHKTHTGYFFRSFYVLLLIYLTSIVIRAFIQQNLSSFALLLLLFLIYGAVIICWKSSPLKPNSLIETIPLLQVYKILQKNDNKHDNQLLCIKELTKTVLRNRLLSILFLLFFINMYYGLAFNISNEYNVGDPQFWNYFISDMLFKKQNLSPKIFSNFCIFTIFSIPFIFYTSNIFVPFEEKSIYSFINKKNLIQKFFSILFVFVFWWVGYKILKEVDYFSSIKVAGIITLFLAIDIFFHYFFILVVVFFRKLALFINKFY